MREFGRRIFPDKLTPTDTDPAARQQVDLVATIEPQIGGRDVYFSVWDVDDPFDQLNSSMPDGGLIDTTPTAGPDNRGVGGGLSEYAKTTGPDGKARVTLTTSMQPGDNFRAAASALSDAGSQVDQPKADAINNEQPATPGNFSGYKVPVVWSPMLTVWRKLHVEVDSMSGADFTNAISGILSTAPTYNAANQHATIPIPTLPADFNAVDQHKVGRIDIPIFGSFVTVKTTTSPPSVEITNAPADIADALGLPFTLWDDDAGSVPPFVMVGFDASPVTLPKVPDTSLMAQVFKDAYVDVPTSDVQYYQADTVFRRNIAPEDEDNNQQAIQVADSNRNLTSGAGYWVVHVTSAFQGWNTKDGDPDTEQASLGLQYGLTVQQGFWPFSVHSSGSLVFLETIRDDKRGNVSGMATLEPYTVVHEAGHQFLLEHEDGQWPTGDNQNPAGDYIMTNVLDQTGMAPNVAFGAKCLAKIRQRDYPPQP